MIITLSVLLLLGSLGGVFRYRHDILHPAFWTNLGFSGYAIGGFYYSILGYENALFLNLAKFDIDGRQFWFSTALLIALAGLLIFNLGFFLGDRHATVPKTPLSGQDNVLSPPITLFGKVSALILTALGLTYYVYFANKVAGGILPMVGQVGAYPYLVAAAGLSSLPFHLIYGGALLWLMLWAVSGRHRWIGLLFIPIGALVTLSSGRIAAANAYLFSAVLFFWFVVYGRAGWKTFVAGLAGFLPINVLYYFFREYTSYAYIGEPEKFPLLAEPASSPVPTAELTPIPETSWISDLLSAYWGKMTYILHGLIGGGNVPDLQQLILIVHGIIEGRLKLTYGATYFDWLVNLLGSRVGSSDTSLQSVGYRILNEYFPEKNGGPTPGMIGEAILNFGVLAPGALFCIAYFMTRIYGSVAQSKSVVVRLFYCQFLVAIWALLLKVDSSLLLGYLWLVAPIGLCWAGLVLLNTIVTRVGWAQRALS